jgi:CRISPR system Cascade subunit CasE
MYLSRLELKPEAAQSRQFWTELEDLYGAHEAIWQLFADGPDRKRDFLFRKEGDGAGSRWYTLAERAPKDTRGFWSIESKPFEPKLEPGRRLAFMVRVNPTVAKAVSKTKSVRHDVVMNAKRLAPKGNDAKSESFLVQEACTAWFKARSGKNGFDFDPNRIEIDGYRRRTGRKSSGIQLSTVEIGGLLTVREPKAFAAMLFGGLGPAKSFGCGLMLIRPA